MLNLVDYLLLLVLVVGGAVYLLRIRTKSASAVENTPVVPELSIKANPFPDGFISKMESTGKTIIIFYGSQTGKLPN